MANCILNRNDIATEYFRMLNPIEHSRTKEDALKYKAEPYVIVADIYSHPNLIGRGGWSWYTGSASWYFVAGIKYILGINRIGEFLEINPKIPSTLNNCHIKYEIEETTYIINILKIHLSEIENIEIGGKNLIIYLDNELVSSNRIKINFDKKIHIVDVKML